MAERTIAKSIADAAHEFGSGAAIALYGATSGNTLVAVVGVALVAAKVASNLTDSDGRLF